jgi:hypothetical protein
MGSNMAENHPITFRFVMQAKEKGATVIHVDPRFTRTSALAAAGGATPHYGSNRLQRPIASAFGVWACWCPWSCMAPAG